MNLLDLYRKLPEANAISDSLYDYQHILDLKELLCKEIVKLQRDLEIQYGPKLLADLRRYWTDKDLLKAGFGFLQWVNTCECTNPLPRVTSPIDTIDTCGHCGKIIY